MFISESSESFQIGKNIPASQNLIYRACGVGKLQNSHFEKESKGVICTEVKTVPLSKCQDPKNPSKPPPNTLCIVWSKHNDRVCYEDLSGSVNAHSKSNLHHRPHHHKPHHQVCILVVNSSNRNKNKCLDRHRPAYCTVITKPPMIPSFFDNSPTSILAWILSFTNPE